MNAFITTTSLLAVLVGVTGIVPQLVTMLRTKSASGQSMLGWGLCFAANLGLGFVNAFGYHAALLAIGDALSMSGCVVAVFLIGRYREAGVTAAPASGHAPVATVTEMHTQEFVALRDAVIAEHQRRTGDLRLAVA